MGGLQEPADCTGCRRCGCAQALAEEDRAIYTSRSDRRNEDIVVASGERGEKTCIMSSYY